MPAPITATRLYGTTILSKLLVSEISLIAAFCNQESHPLWDTRRQRALEMGVREGDFVLSFMIAGTFLVQFRSTGMIAISSKA